MRVTPSECHPRTLASAGRLQLLRGWAFALGLVVAVLVLTVAGGLTVGNPKTWSSAFHAMAAAGMLRWAVLTLAVLSGAMFVVALVLHVVIERSKQ